MINSNNILSIYLGMIIGLILFYIFKPCSNPKIIYVGENAEKYEYNKYVLQNKLKTLL
jgi:hypothetical protein